MSMDVSDLRREYRKSRLEREDLSADPVDQFELWFCQARDAGAAEPNAMCLATSGADREDSGAGARTRPAEAHTRPV